MRNAIVSLSSRILSKLINRLLRRRLGEQRPVFFEAQSTAPGLLAIDANYASIREELMRVMPSLDQIPQYHEVEQGQAAISSQGSSAWRVLYVHMHNVRRGMPNMEYFPRTREVILGIPNTLQAFFSILEPGKCVPAHRGPFLGYLRYHTAFVVPAENAPTIRIKDQQHTWQEGSSMLFDDSHEHEVTNESEGPRVVLIVDVLRPLPWHLDLLNRLARRVFFDRSQTQPALAQIKQLPARS